MNTMYICWDLHRDTHIWQDLMSRSDSREDADIIGNLNAGDTITRLRQLENGWSEVRMSDGSGYIRSDLLTEEVTATTE